MFVPASRPVLRPFILGFVFFSWRSHWLQSSSIPIPIASSTCCWPTMICLPNIRLPSWFTWLRQPLSSTTDDVVFWDKSPRSSTHSVRSSMSGDPIILPNPSIPIELQIPQKAATRSRISELYMPVPRISLEPVSFNRTPPLEEPTPRRLPRIRK